MHLVPRLAHPAQLHTFQLRRLVEGHTIHLIRVVNHIQTEGDAFILFLVENRFIIMHLNHMAQRILAHIHLLSVKRKIEEKKSHPCQKAFSVFHIPHYKRTEAPKGRECNDSVFYVFQLFCYHCLIQFLICFQLQLSSESLPSGRFGGGFEAFILS